MKKGDNVYIDSKYKKFLNKKNHKFCKSYPNLIDVGLRIRGVENGMSILRDKHGLELKVEGFCVKKVIKLPRLVYMDLVKAEIDAHLASTMTKAVDACIIRMGRELDHRAIKLLIDETT